MRILTGIGSTIIHHLLYFWVVASEESVTAECEKLHLVQAKTRSQLWKLEKSVRRKPREDQICRQFRVQVAGRLEDVTSFVEAIRSQRVHRTIARVLLPGYRQVVDEG